MFSKDVVEPHHDDYKKVKHTVATYPGHTAKPPHHDDDHHKSDNHVAFAPDVVEPHHDRLRNVPHTVATYPGHPNTDQQVKKVVAEKK